MNTFGTLFRTTIFGESHGGAVGVCIDGCPPGIAISKEELEEDLAKRKAGAKGTTPRKETDEPHIVSGVYNGFTTGAPITILFYNENTRSKDYDKLRAVPRPGHADFVAHHKYLGYTDPRGGGHFSGRITLGIVAAGVIAKKIIQPIKIEAKLLTVGGNANIEDAVNEAIRRNDSVGGLVECAATQLPIGLGEPFFGSVESVISQMMFSIPAIKAIEFGSGFKAATMYGSEHNDLILTPDGKTVSNHAGGINGGITNSNDIVFRVAVKPTSSISIPQKTINVVTGEIDELVIGGRHDSCIALRVPIIVENGLAIALADLFLQANSKR